MPDYKKHDPRGWCGDPRRGAALGRSSYHAEDKTAPVKLALRRVRLDSGGYDTNGTYWGHGTSLYWCASEDCVVDFCLRAKDRAAAKVKVQEEYPKAKFYN